MRGLGLGLPDHGGDYGRLARDHSERGGDIEARLQQAGARIIAISDVNGGLFNPAGIDIPAALEYSAAQKTLHGFPGGTPISNAELLLLDADVLIPAALGNVLTAENAHDVRAKFIVEAANGPITPEADAIFRQREIPVLPDILANAGGVTVSYFEWVQNQQYFRWDLSRVREELEKYMTRSFNRIWTIAVEKKVPLRTAAYLLAIGRVARATELGGV